MTKILVIEDVHYLRNDIVEMLRFEGFDARGAEDGLVGLDIAQNFRPDLIICDIMMPNLDGYGVLEKIRSDDVMSATPFIFLTAKSDRADIRDGMRRGAEDYLPKPFLSTELLDTIRTRLKRVEDYKIAAERKLTEFRSNITTALPHELRTPLNTIIGFSDLLMLEAGKLDPAQVMEWAQHINLGALRLYRLVENYLTYVRIESIARDNERAEQLRYKRTDEPSAVIEFQAMQRAQQVNREADLTMEVASSKALAIAEADLNKLVDELVDNAFKFSKAGETVSLVVIPQDTGVELRITDQGRGMSQEQVDLIGAFMQFERWFYEQQGTGLGLVIAKRLAELHGGSLRIESEPNQGTTVTVNIPFATEPMPIS